MTRFEPAWKTNEANKVLYEISKVFDLFNFVPVLCLHHAGTPVQLALLGAREVVKSLSAMCVLGL